MLGKIIEQYGFMCLRGNKHAWNTKKLYLALADNIRREESVNIWYCEVNGVWDKLVFLCNLHQPVH